MKPVYTRKNAPGQPDLFECEVHCIGVDPEADFRGFGSTPERALAALVDEMVRAFKRGDAAQRALYMLDTDPKGAPQAEDIPQPLPAGMAERDGLGRMLKMATPQQLAAAMTVMHSLKHDMALMINPFMTLPDPNGNITAHGAVEGADISAAAAQRCRDTYLREYAAILGGPVTAHSDGTRTYWVRDTPDTDGLYPCIAIEF